MNFVVATPEHMKVQIQLQISGLNHTVDPRCTQALVARKQLSLHETNGVGLAMSIHESRA